MIPENFKNTWNDYTNQLYPDLSIHIVIQKYIYILFKYSNLLYNPQSM